MAERLQASVSSLLCNDLEEDRSALDHCTAAASALKLAGPLGRLSLKSGTNKLHREFVQIKQLTTAYHARHHTFWSKCSLAFWLGFWVALLGLPNYNFSARMMIYGETEGTLELLKAEGKHEDWKHTWCNLSASEYQSTDPELDTADCSAANEIETIDFESQAFLENISERGTAGKTCGYRPGRRYMDDYKRFWVVDEEGSYFPRLEYKGNTYKALPTKARNGSAPGMTFAAACLEACEQAANCSCWTFEVRRGSLINGGICYFFTDPSKVARIRLHEWQQWIGGVCQAQAKQDFFCADFMYGRYHNFAPATQLPNLHSWNSSLGDWSSDSRANLYCGILPESWAATWPNVVQMIIFSVYGGTGTTVRLCWQGFIGTSAACLNVFVMQFIYPEGALAQRPCTLEDRASQRCLARDVTYNDPNYNPYLVWLDLLGFVFVILFSNSEVNTMKFGLSWHFFFMMDFMNPTKGHHCCAAGERVFYGLICVEEYWFAAWFTTVFGCVFAVLATLLPYQWLESRSAYSGLCASLNSVSRIWEESIHYICGREQSTKRFHVEALIDGTIADSPPLATHLKAMWWEVALIFTCQSEQVMNQLTQIQENLCDVIDILPALKSCVINEDFTGGHNDFCQQLGPHMKSMVAECTSLAQLCLAAAYQRRMSSTLRKAISDSVEHLDDLQMLMVDAYVRACPTASRDLADETIVLFALSFLARKVTDLARLVPEWHSSARGCCGHLALTRRLSLICRGACKGFRGTWLDGSIFRDGHLRFALRNFVAITVVTVASVHFNQFVFAMYSPIMPATLSLLVSRYQSSAFTNNVHRLLGVLLGKVLPLLIVSGFAQLACHSHLRIYGYFAAVWAYVSLFMYMYFTSAQWSLVGCLIAGFGVYPLLVPCSSTLSPDVYKTRYSELGQMTFAVCVQILVDSLLRSHPPRDMCTYQVKKICTALFGEPADEDKISAMRALFRSDLSALQTSLAEAEKRIRKARMLADEADPKVIVAPGLNTPFKINLLTSALNELVDTLSQFNLVIIGTKAWKVNESVRENEDAASASRLADEVKTAEEILELITNTAYGRFVGESMLESAHLVAASLQVILEHKTEDKMRNPCLDQISSMCTMHTKLDRSSMRRDDFYQEISERLGSHRSKAERSQLTDNPQARIMVTARAIRNFADPWTISICFA
eukprot:TRINITY_DN30230_c0_g1_i2.p1 TRINITY_DN30230_c0_g1~~TRINITY_DN30230_c0_g1_i2.p1  ORF type:complete len:1254 (-),score=157.81 TRINITY_DN30230_c0_g1_i2:48-3578(-)